MLLDLIDLLVPGKTVRIGESTTRVLEGEPFFHPQIWQILHIINNRLKGTPVEIVTSGLLTPDGLKELKSLENISLKISINTLSPEFRERLMGSAAGDIRPVLEKLKKWEIPFSLTFVAQPHLTGWRELENSIMAGEIYGPGR